MAVRTEDERPIEIDEEVAPLAPMHPGKVLREEFMAPYGVSAGKVAKACHLPRTRIERVIREEMGITPDTAVRLGALFGTTAQFWLNLQAGYDAQIATAELAEVAATIEPIRPAA